MGAFAARGPLSEFLLERLAGTPHALSTTPQPVPADPLGDEDLHLALALCYELHYGGLAGVDDGWEWEPSLIAWRAGLERSFELGLSEAVVRRTPGADVASALRALVAADDGPSLSAYMAESATPEQFAEFVVHRSFYQLREADPHTWAIPRLRGRAKAALVTVQADEYGGGREEWMHASMYRRTMQAFDLDDAEHAYLDLIPGVTLATVNLMSLFGLHRRWRGALVGHLAAFEMTSTGPNRRYGDGLRRLGFAPDATAFYDEHVRADAVHERIAADDLAPAVAAGSTQLACDVLFGAACLLALEARFARHLLDSWARGCTSLRSPLFESAAA